MSKYTQLTNTIGLDIGSVVHRPSHSGMNTFVVLAIDRAQNTIGTVYARWWIQAVEENNEETKQQLRLEAERNLQTVTSYYIKPAPKPRKKKGDTYEINQHLLKPTQSIRTPDMYEFD